MSQLPAKPSEDELRIEMQIKELLEKVNIFFRGIFVMSYFVAAEPLTSHIL